MDFQESVKYITDLCRFGINLGLERTKMLLSLAGDPDKDLFIIHIAGTNGKGSTSAMLRSALVSAGFKVGLYTSPHLHSYRERIQINGEYISEKDFAEKTGDIKRIIQDYSEIIPGEPTEFEFLTILAARYFADQKVDYAIFEVGLGGRLDSTNALKTDISIITNIGLDHQDILGDSVSAIAMEKAGIIREGSSLVVGVQDYPEAEAIIVKEALKKNVKYSMARDKKTDRISPKNGFQNIILKDTGENIQLKLQGAHQVDNLLNVLCAYDFLDKDIDRNKFLEGLAKVDWPGRLESFLYQGRNILLDGAHNPQGAKKLKEYLEAEHSEKRILFLMGILDDKDKEGILRELNDLAFKVIISRPCGNRTSKWNELPGFAVDREKYILMEDTAQALSMAVELTKKEDLIVSCGSFYFISEIREKLLQKK